MSLTDTTVKNTYTADGSNRNWEFTFPFRSTDDLRISTVDEDGEETEINTAYEIDTDNSRVIYPTLESGLAPLATGIKITLWRDTPRTQNIDLLRQGVLDAQELEGGFDKLTMITQELDERTGRALMYPAGSDNPLNAAEYLAEIEHSVQSAAGSATQAGASAQAAQTAQNAAVQAQQGAEAAVSAAESAATAAASDAASAAQVWQEVQKRQRKEFIFTAGTPSGSYTGSLTEIDLGTDLTGLDVEVYLNGVNKEQGTEYGVSGTKITFSFELTAGSKVKVRLGDLIRTAKETDVAAAILAHDNDEDAHPALQERISALEQGGGSYELPAATATTLGGVKVGSGLSVTADGTLSASGGGSGGGESWFTLTGENYTAQQLSNGLSSGKAGSYGLGAYASKTITRVEAWAGDGTEGNPYFRLPWPYGWHRSGNFIYLYFVRGGVSLNWSEFYTNANAINVAVRAYYK